MAEWRWRPVTEAPADLQEAAQYITASPGEFITRICFLYDYDAREHAMWVVLCDGSGGSVSHYLNRPLPEPDWGAAATTEAGTEALNRQPRSAEAMALEIAVKALSKAQRTFSHISSTLLNRDGDTLNPLLYVCDEIKGDIAAAKEQIAALVPTAGGK